MEFWQVVTGIILSQEIYRYFEEYNYSCYNSLFIYCLDITVLLEIREIITYNIITYLVYFIPKLVVIDTFQPNLTVKIIDIIFIQLSTALAPGVKQI